MSSNRRLRIPVKFVDGVWECSYGGTVPVSPDTPGDLIVDRGSIADPSFLDKMESKSRYKVLDKGTELLVSLTIKGSPRVSDDLAKHLIPFDKLRFAIATEYLEKWSPDTLHFIRVVLDIPTEAQARRLAEKSGGLWLLAQGAKAIGLISTTIRLPNEVSKDPVASLNHAFTKLSEVYEPWRISHTGNVYTRILYKEKNGKWYPLDLLRNAALDKKEQEIAQSLWLDFLAKTTRNRSLPKN